jgi:hypothetical protein
LKMSFIAIGGVVKGATPFRHNKTQHKGRVQAKRTVSRALLL